MCLTINNNQKAKIATKDITCYKVLVSRVSNIDSDYITPYMEMPVVIGEEYHSEIEIDNGSQIHVALHSFVKLEDAILEYRNWVAYDASVIKCIIPKGSTYYKGRYEIENDSYASDCIKYVEKIDHLIAYAFNLLDILKDTWR